MKTITLICPARDNKKYLQWSYASVRKHCSPDVEYLVAVDSSIDGTEEWCEETSKKDKHFKFIVNHSSRMGHTNLYDQLISLATTEVVMVWHCDMIATPNMDKKILQKIKKGQVISLTRIEPPLHPPDNSKIQADIGTEPENFKEEYFLSLVKELEKKHKGETSEGIFAPWAIFKEDFQAINGHDSLFAPQSKEDSDIFNRFILNGYDIIQLRDVLVGHLTCRGSRFNPNLTEVGTPSDEWLQQNHKSERNFIRKWGTMVRVDSDMKPYIPHKYNIRFQISGVMDSQELYDIEPYADQIVYCLADRGDVEYDWDWDVQVAFNFNKLKDMSFLSRLPDIIENTNDIGTFQYDIFTVSIRSLEPREQDLIWNDTPKQTIADNFFGHKKGES